MPETVAPPPRTLSTQSADPAAPLGIPCRTRTPRNRICNREAHRRHAHADAPTQSRELDWVRHSLRICDFLSSVQSLSPSDRALVAFAIEWAPYGGADPEELFIKFGVHRARFLVLLQAAMTLRTSDLGRLRALKTALRNDLLHAWRQSPTSDQIRCHVRAPGEVPPSSRTGGGPAGARTRDRTSCERCVSGSRGEP
jgi:hypothetical protein